MSANPSPDKGDKGVPLGDASPDEASHTTPDKKAEQETQSSGRPARKAGNDEPVLTLEPDLPSDGRDEVGEAMIRDLPQRPELSEPPSQPEASSNKS